jgi:hypothetical protein
MSSSMKLHLRTETDPVSETLCLLVIEFRTMDKVQKPSINEYNTLFQNIPLFMCCKVLFHPQNKLLLTKNKKPVI